MRLRLVQELTPSDLIHRGEVLEEEVKSPSTYASCQYDKDQIFNETSPNFRLRLMWMAGNLTDDAFDNMAAKMTLEGRESQIRYPHIMLHGEFDCLSANDELYQYFDRLGSEVNELRIYENQFHGVYLFVDEIGSMPADWLRD